MQAVHGDQRLEVASGVAHSNEVRSIHESANGEAATSQMNLQL